MVRTASALAGALALGSLAGCGPRPVEDSAGFPQSPGDTRVFTAFRETATTARGTVRLRAGDRHVMIRVDCVLDTGEHEGSGRDQPMVRVRVFGGEAQLPCQEESNARGGVGITHPRALRRAASVPVVVRTPPHTTWSVAVDAGPDTIDLTDG